MESVRAGGERQPHRPLQPAPLSQAGGKCPESPGTLPQERPQTPTRRHTCQQGRSGPHVDSGGHTRIPRLTLRPTTALPLPGPQAAAPLHSLFCPLRTRGSQQRIREGTGLQGQRPCSLALPGAGILCLITQCQENTEDLLGFPHRPAGEVCGLREDPCKLQSERTHRPAWEGRRSGAAPTRGGVRHKGM